MSFDQKQPWQLGKVVGITGVPMLIRDLTQRLRSPTANGSAGKGEGLGHTGAQALAALSILPSPPSQESRCEGD